MISGQFNFLRNAFNLWKNARKQQKVADAIDGKDKGMLIDTLNRFMKGNKVGLLRLVLRAFD